MNPQSLKVMAVFEFFLQMDKDVATSTCAVTPTLMAHHSVQPAQLSRPESQTRTSQDKPHIDGSPKTPCSLETCQSFVITNNPKPKMLSSMVDFLVDSCALTLQSSLTFSNSFNLACTEDASFINVCIAVLKAAEDQELNGTPRAMPNKFKGINVCGLKLVINKSMPVCAIWACTEKPPWHQWLGHPCDECLCNAHEHMTGAPKFDCQTAALDQCPTCIQAKQTEVPAGPHLTHVVT